jgi:hypothetical protein
MNRADRLNHAMSASSLLQFGLAGMLWSVVIVAVLVGVSLKLPGGMQGVLLVGIVLGFASSLGVIGCGEVVVQPFFGVCRLYFILIVAILAFALPSGLMSGALLASTLLCDERPWRKWAASLLVIYSTWVLQRYINCMEVFD